VLGDGARSVGELWSVWIANGCRGRLFDQSFGMDYVAAIGLKRTSVGPFLELSFDRSI
jgi:hypothetical protein